MSVAILISGSIFREPQQRVSQSGKSYVTTTIKATTSDNSSSDFWSVLCFSASAGAELMRLGLNEKLAVQGTPKLEIFEKDGQARISKTIFCDHVLALRAPPKERKPKAPPAGSKAADALAKQSIVPPSDLNDDLDDLPF
jgi:hypothetical protein